MLSAKDKHLFSSVCQMMHVPANSEIEMYDEYGSACFYIVLEGMVREYSKTEDNEETRAFYCENEFFGSYSKGRFNEQLYFQTMEPAVMYRIVSDQWEALQTLSPSIKTMWYSLLENQIMNAIQWQEAFRGMRASDLFQLLLRQKPALWHKSRLHSVITSLYNP